MAIDYAYYLSAGEKVLQKDIHVEFDPASVAKLFYLLFFAHNFSSTVLESTKLTVGLSAVRKFGKGTRTIRWWWLGRKLSLAKLLELSITQSCNVATGMLADYASREKVNQFITDTIGLKQTTVYSRTSRNKTTVSDLLKILRFIIDNQREDEQTFVRLLLSRNKRRAVFKELFPNYEVMSKGGTTFSGLRRDCAIVQFENNAGFMVLVQVTSDIPKFSKLDRILAKVHRGKLSQYLRQLNVQFVQKASQLVDSLQ